MLWPRRGDGVAGEFEEAYERLAATAYKVGMRFFRGSPQRHHRAEEVAQETLTRAYEFWERARRHGKPEAWVVMTATNVCQELVRKERRATRPSPFAAPLVAPGGEDDVDAAAFLAGGLRHLTKREREVVVWRYLLDASEAETAEELGMTTGQVKETASRGRTKLRRVLGDEEASEPW